MIRRLTLAAALASMVWLTGTAAGQLTAAGEAQGAPGRGRPGGRAMAEMTRQMPCAPAVDSAADDAKLDGLLRQMNEAKGEARLDAVVAAVNELARQNRAERAHMREMHQRMMREPAAALEPAAHQH
jgi:hypothetical protein